MFGEELARGSCVSYLFFLCSVKIFEGNCLPYAIRCIQKHDFLLRKYRFYQGSKNFPLPLGSSSRKEGDAGRRPIACLSFHSICSLIHRFKRCWYGFPEVGCAVRWHSTRAAIAYATVTLDLKPDIEKPELGVLASLEFLRNNCPVGGLQVRSYNVH